MIMDRTKLCAKLFAISSAIDEKELEIEITLSKPYYRVFGTEEERNMDIQKLESEKEELKKNFDATLKQIKL